MKKYFNVLNVACIFFSLYAIIFFCCTSCSNSNKLMVNKKTQNNLDEETQIELDLVKNSIREFINSNNNAVLSDFNLTLKTLEGQRFQLKNGKWKIGQWVIDKVDIQEPIARYFIDYGSESLMLFLFLSKKDGVYKVIDWKDEKVLGW